MLLKEDKKPLINKYFITNNHINEDDINYRGDLGMYY
jgi:hypothetical protein